MVTIKNTIRNIVALTTLCFSGMAHAAGNTYLVVEFGQIKINEQVANVEGINNSANRIRVGAQKKYVNWNFSGGLGGFLYSDRQGFSQNVVDQFGNQSTASSSSSATNVYFDVGYSYALSSEFLVNLQTGYEHVASSSRKIANCQSCSKVTINVKAGTYIAPRIAYQLGRALKLSLVYRQFLSGDIKSDLAFNMAWRF